MAKGVFVADFETRGGENAVKERKTWVWGWSICNILDIDNVITGSSIETFFKHIKTLGDCVVYFHNLKFDGNFILDYLLRSGWEYTEDRKDFRESKKCFSTLIDDTGIFYTITINNGRRTRCEFRDSMKKVPAAVKKLAKDFKTRYKKLELDYIVDRPENYIPTIEELDYMKNDVRVVGEVLNTFYEQGFDKMTIGSDALTYYKNLIGKRTFEKRFPQLESQCEYYCRKAYKGGYCYVKKDVAGKTYNKTGNTYDVNSLYPSMLSSTEYEMYGKKVRNYYPVGAGVYFKGQYKEATLYPLYVQHFKAAFVLKENMLPTIQLKHTGRFADNEYIEDSGAEMQDLYLTNVDMEMFLLHYDIISIEYIDGYMFVAARGMFDRYVNHFMEVKETTTGAPRTIAKLYLNNLYGKFGQSLEGRSKTPYYDDEQRIVRYTITEGQQRKGVYVPIAAWCTAYSRRFTIYHAQLNYKNFCYADTDSIHMFGEAEGIVIHPTHLCTWKHECEWDRARFLRQKTYAEHIVKEDGEIINPYWLPKCAGMTDEVKEKLFSLIDGSETDVEHNLSLMTEQSREKARRIIELKDPAKLIDIFDVGLGYEFLVNKSKVVEGGVIIYDGKFSIKG